MFLLEGRSFLYPRMFLYKMSVDVFGDPIEELEKRQEGRRCCGRPGRVEVIRFFRRHTMLVQRWRILLARVEDDHLCNSLEYGQLGGNEVSSLSRLCHDGLFSQRCLVFQGLGRCEKVRYSLLLQISQSF